MTMATRDVICIKAHGGSGIAQVRVTADGELSLLGGSPSVLPAIERVIEDIRTNGAFIPVESPITGGIGVSLRDVEPRDSAYAAAVRDAFEAEGFNTSMHDGSRAELWRLAYALPVDTQLRTMLVPRLEAVSDDLVAAAITDLRAVEEKLKAYHAAKEKRAKGLADLRTEALWAMRGKTPKKTPDKKKKGRRPKAGG